MDPSNKKSVLVKFPSKQQELIPSEDMLDMPLPILRKMLIYILFSIVSLLAILVFAYNRANPQFLLFILFLGFLCLLNGMRYAGILYLGKWKKIEGELIQGWTNGSVGKRILNFAGIARGRTLLLQDFATGAVYEFQSFWANSIYKAGNVPLTLYVHDRIMETTTGTYQVTVYAIEPGKYPEPAGTEENT